jgi:hypothetical protein
MKKILLILCSMIFLISCKKDFLSREPLSELSPNNSFNSESELKLYTNSFYNALPSATDVYGETEDNIVLNSLSATLAGNRTVPVTGGGWSWNTLRNINFFLQNYSKGHLSEKITAPYVATAKFFRAYFYFEKVKTFGDVPWYSVPIEANDSVLLYKERDSRMLIIDSVLSDLNFAIDNLPLTKSTDKITKWTALALKSRICLYEGTFRKYHADDAFGKDSYGNKLSGANDLLQQCIEASELLMSGGQYSLYTSGTRPYQDLFTSPSPISSEIILARQYNSDLLIYHNANYYTLTPSYGKPGLEKKLVNSYLMKDGTRFTDIPGFQSLGFYEEMQNRDPRLSQTVRAPGYSRIGSDVRLSPSFGASTTGYQLIKFVMDDSHDKINGSIAPMPIFRYAEVLLNFIEAKAELGTISQEDIDMTINLLRSRVKMPPVDLLFANSNPDPYLEEQYKQVSGSEKGIILEIRRERRIELVMEGFRWDDIMRWKEGELLAQPFYGMYFPGTGEYDLDGDGKTDVIIYSDTKPSEERGVQYLKLNSEINLQNGQSGGNVVVNGSIPKTFNENRDYLYPIPTQDLLLNKNLTQNPGW